MPFYAVLCAEFSYRVFESSIDTVKSLKWFFGFALVFVILYPYGAYKTNTVHDAITSMALAGSVFAFGYWLLKHKISAKILFTLIILAASANFSQVVNYRNEQDTEYPFCEWAREEYKNTGKPIHTKEQLTRNKDMLYCRGIPIIYEK